jgi:hypothetical protein
LQALCRRLAATGFGGTGKGPFLFVFFEKHNPCASKILPRPGCGIITPWTRGFLTDLD